jgi:methylenetetrahydrofolate reductase (NADPH)
MERLFNDTPYLIELLTPKQNIRDLDAALERFRSRYMQILAHDTVVSIPDNPMGILRFTALEVIQHLGLPVKPEQLLIHLNTFHRKIDLDEMLQEADSRGIRYLLCVSGDGGPRLSKLEPEDLGTEEKSVTSVELLRYIGSSYPNRFTLGVAFNQYEPLDFELKKLEVKIESGARFVVTQPVVETDKRIEKLMDSGLPVYLGAWMSKKTDLLNRCIGYNAYEDLGSYNPVENLRVVEESYESKGVYLSFLSLTERWDEILLRSKALHDHL